MTAVRRDITASTPARDRYLDGVLVLAQEPAGITTREVNDRLGPQLPGFRIFGGDQPLMTWDLFVLWHHVAMTLTTSPRRPLRNSAHGGPVFLPWHRLFLLRLEQQLQRVLDDADAGLPYWNWAADGAGPGNPADAPLWQPELLGPARGEVTTGALADLRVRLVGFGTQLWSVPPRPLVRQAGADTPSLPTPADVTWALGPPSDTAYDRAPWDATTNAFRNRLEGWLDPTGRGEPRLHNQVHVWVGGDMSPGTSPNDPVFYLHHANVDRLWETWMTRHGRAYQPRQADPQAPVGHRLEDSMAALLGAPLRPSEVLDPTPWYRYDSLHT